MKISIKKNVLALLIGVALFASCNKKQGYTINGEVSNELKLDSIYLYDDTFQKVIASAPVINGKFTLKGVTDSVKQVLMANMSSKTANIQGRMMILENTTYTSTITPKETAIKGGTFNDLVYSHTYSDTFRNLMDDMSKVNQELADGEGKMDKATIISLEQKQGEIQDKLDAFHAQKLSEIIEGKNPTMAKMFALINNGDFKTYPTEKRLQLLGEYEKELGKQPAITTYINQLNASTENAKVSQEVAVGKQYKPVSGPDRNGKEIKLEDVIAKNKFVLLEFWASWCSPCRAEIPNLKNAYKKYKSKGFEIYSISLDKKKDEWIAAMDKEKPMWINVLNEEGFDASPVKSYAVTGIPQSYLISKEGVIVASNDDLRTTYLDATLAKFLK